MKKKKKLHFINKQGQVMDIALTDSKSEALGTDEGDQPVAVQVRDDFPPRLINHLDERGFHPFQAFACDDDVDVAACVLVWKALEVSQYSVICLVVQQSNYL